MSDGSQGATSPGRRSSGLLVWLVLTQLAGLLSLIPWSMMAGMSLMAFDSGDQAAAMKAVAWVWSYPILPLASAVAAWIFYANRRYRIALLVTSLPLLLAVPLLVYVAAG